MKPLTEKQRTVWDMRESGKTQNEIAAQMGISRNYVNKAVQAIRKKLGMESLAPIGGSPVGRSIGTEYKNPEKFAAVLDAVSETKLTTLADALRDNGVPPGAADGIIKRIKVKFYGAVTEVRNLKKLELDEMLGKKIHLMLQYIDDKVVAEASARDLAMGIAQLIEKQQLIRGEPTQIISDLERKKLHELLPLAIAEAQRRGLTIEGKVLGKEIEPVGA